MSSIDRPDDALPQAIPEPTDTLEAHENLLQGKVFQWIQISPNKSVGVTETVVKSLLKVLSKAGMVTTPEVLRAYLESGALAHEDAGIAWDGESKRYTSVAPPEAVAPAAPEAPPAAIEPAVSLAEYTHLRPWATLHEMKQEEKLAIFKAIYDYLQQGPSEDSDVGGDRWYLNPEVIRTLPTTVRQVIDKNPDLIGFEGEKGTFGGLLVALNMGRQYDTARDDGSFANHIKLLPRFRTKTLQFKTALEIVQRGADKKKNSLFKFALGGPSDEEILEKYLGDEEFADSDRKSVKETMLGMRDKAVKSAAENSGKKGGSKRGAPVREARKAAIAKKTDLTDKGSERGAVSDPDSGEDMRWLEGREAEVLAAEGKEGELSFDQEVRLARLQHALNYDRYVAQYDGAKGDVNAQARFLVAAVDKSVEAGMRLERLRSRTERESDGQARLKELDRGVLASQLRTFQNVMAEVDRALENKHMGEAEREKLVAARGTLSGLLKQYEVKVKSDIEITGVSNRLTGSIAMGISHDSEEAALAELPERLFDRTTLDLLVHIGELDRGDLAPGDVINMTAAVIKDLRVVIDTIAQMRKAGTSIAVERQVLTPIQLAIRTTALPDDLKPLRQSIESLRSKMYGT